MTTVRYAGEAAANQYGVFQVKPASGRQIGFIRKLMTNRDLTNWQYAGTDPNRVGKDSASRVIDSLLALPERAVQASADNRQPNRYPSQCVRCDGPVAANAGYLVRTSDSQWKAEHRGDCPTPTLAAPVERDWNKEDSGMYREPTTGQIYKVYCAVHGSGRMVCKLLNVDTRSFEYRGLAERYVRRDWRMTLDEAKQFGQIYGVCCVCAATLTDENSIREGIGPICGGRGRW